MWELVQQEDQEPRRLSSIAEVAQLFAELVRHGMRTMAFCTTRKLSELVLLYAKEALKASGHHEMCDMVRPPSRLALYPMHELPHLEWAHMHPRWACMPSQREIWPTCRHRRVGTRRHAGTDTAMLARRYRHGHARTPVPTRPCSCAGTDTSAMLVRCE
jgi:hypothetical protein